MEDYHILIVRICCQFIPQRLFLTTAVSSQARTHFFFIKPKKDDFKYEFHSEIYGIEIDSFIRQTINGVETPVMIYGKNFYDGVNGLMDYDATVAFCNSQPNGMSIPLPKSQEDNNFVKDLLTHAQQTWLGVSDEERIICCLDK